MAPRSTRARNGFDMAGLIGAVGKIAAEDFFAAANLLRHGQSFVGETFAATEGLFLASVHRESSPGTSVWSPGDRVGLAPNVRVLEFLMGCVMLMAAPTRIERSLCDAKDRLQIERLSFCIAAGSVNDRLIYVAHEIGFRGAIRPVRARRLHQASYSERVLVGTGRYSEHFSKSTRSVLRYSMPNASRAVCEVSVRTGSRCCWRPKRVWMGSWVVG